MALDTMQDIVGCHFSVGGCYGMTPLGADEYSVSLLVPVTSFLVLLV